MFLVLFFLTIEKKLSSEPYYYRFTTPKQSSLILGSSRSAQGLNPEIINKQIGSNLYNYSFTINNSPYGPYYFNSIKKKLSKKNNDGIFILTVDPWSISTKKIHFDNTELFDEKNMFIGKLNIVNMNPNIYYLFNHYKTKNFKDLFFLDTNNQEFFLHKKTGWLEVNVLMDSSSLSKRFQRKNDIYKNHMNKYEFSENRYKFLKKTINYLSDYGKIYLVRLPIHNSMMEIENNNLPLIVCGTGGKVYDDINYLDCLDKKSELEFFSNNLGYGFIQASPNTLEITFLDEKNRKEINFEIKK